MPTIHQYCNNSTMLWTNNLSIQSNNFLINSIKNYSISSISLSYLCKLKDKINNNCWTNCYQWFMRLKIHYLQVSTKAKNKCFKENYLSLMNFIYMINNASDHHMITTPNFNNSWMIDWWLTNKLGSDCIVSQLKTNSMTYSMIYLNKQ